MHIPDGYLSPSTCAALYAASAPFWYTALRGVQRTLSSRAVPLLSVFSAFSFVIMMFNLPLPGGTTGHAVGMAIAAIVLGPFVAMLSVSVALLIQALLFGDGGITTFGANCFNMAIVGSLVAAAVYRLIAGRAPLLSLRRSWAAGLAGYSAINAAALLAAVEFGLQPRFFHTAHGVPLYAPYPLHIAVPAMMIGHLTLAGLAEFVISAGLVRYLQRADPALLERTAPHAAPLCEAQPYQPVIPQFATSRRLWAVCGILLMLTPFGILAGGAAWGEWSAADFSDVTSREQIASASGGHAPPIAAPAGLARLSALWTAPIPGYTPRFLHSPVFAYFASAALGLGAIVLLILLFSWLLARLPAPKRIRPGFFERTTASLLCIADESLFAETIARQSGPLQSLDPRVKLIAAGAFFIAIIASHNLAVCLALFLLSLVLASFARIPLKRLAARAWLSVLLSTGALALPALFLTSGESLSHVPILDWTITRNGLTTAAFLVLRAETAVTLLLVLLATTRWYALLRALRTLRLPASLILILQMTYRYIFVFLQLSFGLLEARRTRLLGPLGREAEGGAASSIAGVLLHRSFSLSSDIHLAMQARGFRGEIRLLEDLRLRNLDRAFLAAALLLAACAIWLGR